MAKLKEYKTTTIDKNSFLFGYKDDPANRFTIDDIGKFIAENYVEGGETPEFQETVKIAITDDINSETINGIYYQADKGLYILLDGYAINLSPSMKEENPFAIGYIKDKNTKYYFTFPVKDYFDNCLDNSTASLSSNKNNGYVFLDAQNNDCGTVFYFDLYRNVEVGHKETLINLTGQDVIVKSMDADNLFYILDMRTNKGQKVETFTLAANETIDVILTPNEWLII